jgi:hypothetical protein
MARHWDTFDYTRPFRIRIPPALLSLSRRSVESSSVRRQHRRKSSQQTPLHEGYDPPKLRHPRACTSPTDLPERSYLSLQEGKTALPFPLRSPMNSAGAFAIRWCAIRQLTQCNSLQAAAGQVGAEATLEATTKKLVVPGVRVHDAPRKSPPKITP